MLRIALLSTLFFAHAAQAQAQAAPSTPAPAALARGASGTCASVTNAQAAVPQSQDIYRVDITQVDGKSTPLAPENRYKVKPGTRVLTVTDAIDPHDLPAAAIAQIEKMKRLKEQRAYKKVTVEAKPGVTYAVGARLLRDKLDVDSIHDNAYWEPVVYDQRPSPCK